MEKSKIEVRIGLFWVRLSFSSSASPPSSSPPPTTRVSLLRNRSSIQSFEFCLKLRMKESKLAKLNQQQQQDNHQSVHLSPSKLAKLFDPDASWDKDQLGDVLHWIRQVVGLICGLLWGSIPLVGGIWIILFLAISSGIVYGYYAMILKVDEEDFGGHAALLKEGLFASLTLFLVKVEKHCFYSAANASSPLPQII